MTLKELAELAHVSQSTVSKAFSNAKDISTETREYIFKVAKEYNCYEKFHKGNYFKKIVAVICPEIKTELYHRIVARLETLLDEEGISMALSISHFQPDTEKALFYYHAHYQKVDGIIIIAGFNRYKDEDSVPTVRIGSFRDSNPNVISTPYQNAINDAVKYLMNMGHRKIGYIGDFMTHPTENRFFQSMKKYYLPLRKEYVIITSKRFEEGGYDGMKQLLELPAPPTAVIAAYDYMAFGALKCIQDYGLSVPEDISMIGQGNLQMSSYSLPTLTTIDIPYQEQCDLAIQLLQKKMKNNSYIEISLNTSCSTLITRDSVKDLKETP